jgi:nucleoside phosphorylase
MDTRLDPNLYTVAWIAPLEIEAQAARNMLDKRHDGQFHLDAEVDYVFEVGEICGHYAIIFTFIAGQEYGTASAAALASRIKTLFPSLRFGLLVGVAAGLPNHSRNPPIDIRLGDVLVSLPTATSNGVVAYDLGRETEDDAYEPLLSGCWLSRTNDAVRSAIGRIKGRAPDNSNPFLPYYDKIMHENHTSGDFIDPGQDRDHLYQVVDNGVEQVEQPVEREQRPSSERTRVWYGAIGSGDKVLKNSQKRNELRDRYNIIGLEMEAAGIMNIIPVGVIRGVCDYGDKHKNKEWQPYAAAMAAAYAKGVLNMIPPKAPQPKPAQHLRGSSFTPRDSLTDDDIFELMLKALERVSCIATDLGVTKKRQVCGQLGAELFIAVTSLKSAELDHRDRLLQKVRKLLKDIERICSVSVRLSVTD